MENAGSALMGIGYGSGENRAIEAARSAIESPLLELSITGAKGLLLSVTGGTDLSMFEVDEAARMITEACDPNANIIFGTSIDEKYTGEIKITVIATGFSEETNAYMGTRVGGNTTQSSIFSNNRMGAAPIPSTMSSSKPAFESHSMSSSHRPSAPAHHAPAAPAAAPQSELDVPAFLRNRNK